MVLSFKIENKIKYKLLGLFNGAALENIANS
jgi:hypothetical protein